jgi:hypothetical protein
MEVTITIERKAIQRDIIHSFQRKRIMGSMVKITVFKKNDIGI